MLDRLEVVGRPEKVVGWYHSHPGFGCWLSMADVRTAEGYEKITERSVSVVVDPIQSVRGKVVIDAFRTIPQEMMLTRQEPRQTTSNVGFMARPTAQALANGLNTTFYSMPIMYRKNPCEINMLLNVHKKGWQEGFRLEPVQEFENSISESIQKMKSLSVQVEKFISGGVDEDEVGNVGKMNPAVHLRQEAEELLNMNINQSIGAMLNALVF